MLPGTESDDPADPGPSRPSPRGRRLRRGTTRYNLTASTADGTAYSVMVGLGENAFGPFVLAMHPEAVVGAGLVMSVPLMLGAVLQMLGPRLVDRLRSHRNAVVAFSILQGLALLPLAAGALTGWMPLTLLFACASVYWGAGLGAGAAWNTWAATLVPGRIRNRYFALRARAIHAGVLLGLLAGGLLLQSIDDALARYAFAGMFTVACLCRLASARFQAVQSEPIPMPPGQRRVGMLELLSRLRSGIDARLMVYMLAMQLTINLAQPFFIPYALKEVEVGYATYYLLIAAPFAARMLAFSLLGSVAHRFGSRRLLWVGGVGLLPISGLWLLSPHPAFLLLVQFLAGIAWAAYELGTFLTIWETIADKERTSILTTFNLLSATANTGGALLGGQLLEFLGKGLGGYHAVFALSLVLRIATLILLVRLQSALGSRVIETRVQIPPAPPSPPAPPAEGGPPRRSPGRRIGVFRHAGTR